LAKTFLKVTAVWDNAVCSSNKRQFPLPRFIFQMPCQTPQVALADRETVWR
jgi:hypothetical protein